MFIPGDEFLRAALEADPGLVEEGMARNVVIATPATFMALLRTVKRRWRQQQLAQNARAISDLGRQLYDRLPANSRSWARPRERRSRAWKSSIVGRGRRWATTQTTTSMTGSRSRGVEGRRRGGYAAVKQNTTL